MQASGSYDPVLVALSMLIAALASYTALDISARMRASEGTARFGWGAAAAVAMGGGIWSMHFIGMLAFQPWMQFSYDPLLTFVSLVLPVLVSGAAFAVIGRGPRATVAAGVVMGLGIAIMHYTGMEAMRKTAIIGYDPVWIVISVLIAIVAAVTALRLASVDTSSPQRLGAGLVMGFAISGMHYSAMYGATCAPAGDALIPGHSSVGQAPLAFLVAGTTIMILILGLAAAVYDRTAAELAEREASALRRSEERFRLLVEGVADHAIFWIDTDGLVANWNLGAERLLGHGPEIVGHDFALFYAPEDREAGLPARSLTEAESDGRSESEGWRVRKDGSRFWAEVTTDAVYNDAGEVVGFAKIVRDVTERRRAQEALERTRDALVMSQKMETVGQIAGGVAHDFNNLLGAILGSLELLNKRIVSDDPKVQRLIENAIQGALRGKSLTQRMLAFARKQDLKPVVVDLPELVRGMTSLLKFDPSIRVETRFPIGLPKVKVDFNQLELSVLNLAVNARDAMPKGGTITIAAREEKGADGLAEGRYVALVVNDTGVGMDRETLAHAQEPFFTTKGVGKGTGLGLSMVHGLAEQSGGRLVLKSIPNEGTTAEIWLPVAADEVLAAPSPARTEPPPAVRSGRRLSVLVVDDDLLVLENTAAMLEDLGHAVIEATSGAQAIEMLGRTRTIDLVVTDFAMPGMNGAELAEAIEAERPGTPVLLSTGYAELPKGTRRLPRISKPFDQATLARAIEETLRDDTVVPFRPKGSLSA